MAETTVDALRDILKSLLEEAEDEDVSFKLRTALQLLVVMEDRQELARSAIDQADLDPAVRESLRKLGYID